MSIIASNSGKLNKTRNKVPTSQVFLYVYKKLTGKQNTRKNVWFWYITNQQKKKIF